MEIVLYAIIFIMGSFMGSFASLAIYRIPLKEDILIKHSYCPLCNKELSIKDLVPIFSYIFLKGRCRHCGEKIRPRYLVLEILSGFSFLLFVLSFNIDIYHVNIYEVILIAFLGIYFLSFILIAGIDKENKKIENGIILFVICVNAIYILYMLYLHLDIIYDLGLVALSLMFFVVNMYFIKNEKYKYFINFLIIILLSRIIINSYILLFALGLTIVTSIIHKLVTKTKAPIAFYFVIFLISTFIGANFIV